MSQYSGSPNPPMSSDFQVVEPPPGWPKVVGIISIVLASLGLFCGLCAMGFTFGIEGFLQWAAQMQQQPGANVPASQQIPTTPLPAALKPGGLQLLSAVAWPIGAIVLMVAGISTVRRRAGGRTQHIVYGCWSILFTLLGAVGAWVSMSAMNAYFTQYPDDPWKPMMQGQGAGQFVQALMFSCVALLYPGFCLVWFGMLGKRPEAGAAIEEPIV